MFLWEQIQLQNVKKVVDNLQTVLSIELFTGSQALSFSNGKSSPFIESIVSSFREEVSIVDEDRVLHYDIKNTSRFITSLVIDSDELFG
jgi:histidine ammonia-lyase